MMSGDVKLAKEVKKKLRYELKKQGKNFIFPEELKEKIQSVTVLDLSDLSFPLYPSAMKELVSNWQHGSALYLRDTLVTKEVADLLSELTGLRFLDLCRTNSDDSVLAAVAKCKELENLILDGCLKITTLQPLAYCTQLQSLQFLLCYKIDNLEPIAACSSLQELIMSFCTEIHDLQPLFSCKRLQSLCLRGCHGVTAREKGALQKALPQLVIEE